MASHQAFNRNCASLFNRDPAFTQHFPGFPVPVVSCGAWERAPASRSEGPSVHPRMCAAKRSRNSAGSGGEPRSNGSPPELLHQGSAALLALRPLSQKVYELKLKSRAEATSHLKKASLCRSAPRSAPLFGSGLVSVVL